MVPSGPNEHGDSAENVGANDRARRVAPSQVEASTEARLMPGGDAEVINISNTGMRVEGKTRLMVGSAVSIRVRGNAIKRFNGTIVRSHVSTIHRDGSLSYESAIEFDRPYPVVGPVTDEQRAGAVGRSDEAAPAGSEEGVYVIDADSDW